MDKEEGWISYEGGLIYKVGSTFIEGGLVYLVLTLEMFEIANLVF